MNNNYNTYNRHFADYWNTRTPIGGVQNASASPAAASSSSIGTNDIFSHIHNDVLNGARMLNTLSNATTHTHTPVDSPLISGHRGTYMDDEILLSGLNGGSGLGPAAIPVTPPRPARRTSELPPPILRRGRGAQEMFRNFIPDFFNMTEPTLFMATARTYRVHPLNELNQQNENNMGLTQDEINSVTRVEEREEGQCPICYDDYSGNDLRVINNCNHAFHSECIDRWFIGNRTCPMCRSNVIANTNQQTGINNNSSSSSQH
jgi:hypothetical protein